MTTGNELDFTEKTYNLSRCLKKIKKSCYENQLNRQMVHFVLNQWGSGVMTSVVKDYRLRGEG